MEEVIEMTQNNKLTYWDLEAGNLQLNLNILIKRSTYKKNYFIRKKFNYVSSIKCSIMTFHIFKFQEYYLHCMNL